MTATSALSQGLLLGLGVFIYPGPKDLVVLRMALAGLWPAGLVAIGALSDALLIAIGMAGVSALLQQSPALQHLALWVGVAGRCRGGAVANPARQSARALHKLRGRAPK